MSRYSYPCPACGASIRPSDIRLHGDSFPCPSCGEWLKSDPKYPYAICAVTILLATIVTWRIGYRDGVFIFITIGATVALCLVGLFLFGILIPPVYKRVEGGKAFDKAPSLFVKNKPGAGKKIDP
jgi:hypothetical protein